MTITYNLECVEVSGGDTGIVTVAFQADEMGHGDMNVLVPAEDNPFVVGAKYTATFEADSCPK